MYHSWNLRRLLRYLALDTALVLAAVLLTHLGKHHFPQQTVPAAFRFPY